MPPACPVDRYVPCYSEGSEPAECHRLAGGGSLRSLLNTGAREREYPPGKPVALMRRCLYGLLANERNDPLGQAEWAFRGITIAYGQAEGIRMA